MGNFNWMISTPGVMLAHAHHHCHDGSDTARNVIAAGAVLASLVVIVAVVFGAKALLRRSASSRPVCTLCGHYLDSAETECPFCGTQRPGNEEPGTE